MPPRGYEWGTEGFLFIAAAMCNTHNTQVGGGLCGYSLLVALISKAICSSCIDRACAGWAGGLSCMCVLTWHLFLDAPVKDVSCPCVYR